MPPGMPREPDQAQGAKLVFKTEPLKKVQIDFNAGEPYGKVVIGV